MHEESVFGEFTRQQIPRFVRNDNVACFQLARKTQRTVTSCTDERR